MILGHIRDYMPRVSLTLLGVNGPLSIEFILDTGFEGELSLPYQLLSLVDAIFLEERTLQFADGSLVKRSAYMVDLEWNDEVRPTEVVVLENAPLLGAILLNETHVDLEMRSGGEVVIELN